MSKNRKAGKPAEGTGDRVVKVRIGGKARNIVMPGDDEDEALTAAAAADPDALPLTDAQLARFKPPRRAGRPPQDSTKVPTSIRLDNVVLDSFKATGEGWQTRVNAALLEYLAGHRMLARRYRATVQQKGKEEVRMDEFLVVAMDDGEARQKVKDYLRQMGRAEDARGEVYTEDVGNAVLREVAVIR